MVLCLAISLAGPAAAGDRVRIAAIFAQSGAAANSDRPIWQALRLTVSQINTGGGTGAGEVELIELDNRGTAIGAHKAAEEAVRQKVSVVIGASRSSESLAMAPVLQAAGIPMVSPSSTHPELTATGSYIFRMLNSDSKLANVLAGFAREKLKARTAVLLTNNDNQYSISMSALFRAFFTIQGGKVLDEQHYLPDRAEHGEILKPVKALKPDLLFIPGYPRDAGGLVKKAHELGITAHMMGGDAWGEDMYAYAGDALHGHYYTLPWNPSPPPPADITPLTDKFIKTMDAPLKASVSFAHDTLLLVADALNRCRSADPADIREAIAQTYDLNGITGKILFNHRGDRIMPYLIFRFENRSSVLIETIMPVKLALLINLGPLKPLFITTDPLLASSDFAVRKINGDGGIAGRPLEIIVIDTQRSALGSKMAARKVLKIGVDGIIGGTWSSQGLAMAPIFQKNETVMIAPTSSHPDITRTGDFIFRACFTDPFQGTVMAQFAIEGLKARSAVVLTNTDRQYSISLSRHFSDHYRARGGKILWQGDFSGKSLQYEDILNEVKRLNPDVVFAPTANQEGGLLIKQARRMGISATFLGGDAWDNLIYDYAGNAAEGSYSTTNWHTNAPYAASRQFVAEYSAAGGNLTWAVQGQAMIYESIMLFAAGARAAACPKAHCIRDALLGLKEYQGVAGPIRFNQWGDPDKAAVILKFNRGTSVFHGIVPPP